MLQLHLSNQQFIKARLILEVCRYAPPGLWELKYNAMIYKMLSSPWPTNISEIITKMSVAQVPLLMFDKFVILVPSVSITLKSHERNCALIQRQLISLLRLRTKKMFRITDFACHHARNPITVQQQHSLRLTAVLPVDQWLTTTLYLYNKPAASIIFQTHKSCFVSVV